MDKPVPKTGRPRRPKSSQNGNLIARITSTDVTIRFTGAAGGTSYSVDKLVLRRGDEIRVPYVADHWLELILSGNAEIVEQ